jgi:hypothetical protein
MESKVVLPKPIVMNHHHWNLSNKNIFFLYIIFPQWHIVHILLRFIYMCPCIFLCKNGYV